VSYALAQALWATGVRDGHVRDLARQAIDGFRRLSRDDDASDAERWLARTLGG
jgi:hypothetical protein